MAKDRTRHARLSGKGVELRRQARCAAALRRESRSVRAYVTALVAAQNSLIDAMARSVDYDSWLLGEDDAPWR